MKTAYLTKQKQRAKMESLLSILYLEMKSRVAQAGHELLILLPTSGMCYQASLESSFTLA